jgi:hypothetical protein
MAPLNLERTQQVALVIADDEGLGIRDAAADSAGSTSPTCDLDVVVVAEPFADLRMACSGRTAARTGTHGTP